MAIPRSVWCGVLLGAFGVACGDGNAAAPAPEDEGDEPTEDSEPLGPEPARDDDESSASDDDAEGPEPAVDPDEMLPVEPEVLADDDAPSPCERELTFEAVGLDEPPPFDVVIVADHSDSLSWSREDLSQGLESLLDDVRGHDARFFVLTPTQYGASSASAIDMVTGEQLVRWQDPATGMAYSHEATEYSVACADLNGAAIACPAYPPGQQYFSMQGTWNLRAGSEVASITGTMTKAEVAAQGAALRDAILSLQGGGAQDEQPLCTLHRYLEQDPAGLPENVVFIVISDEDDTSDPSDCLSGYVYESQPIESTGYVHGCTGDCPAHMYSATSPEARRTVSYSCVPVDDFGMTFPAEAWSGGHVEFSDTCAGVSQAECTSGETVGAERECGAGTVVENCTTTCSEDAAEEICLVILEQPELDPCTESFEYEGTTYANFLDYCNQRSGEAPWNGCVREGMFIETAVNFTGGGHLQGLTGTSRIIDMIDSFKSKAEDLFGDQHFVEAIVFAPEFECTPDTGQSFATYLRYVASTQDDVFPICESYAPALSRVQEFSRALLRTEYEFTLKEGEDLEGIDVMNGEGEVRELLPDQYSLGDGVLRIEPEALTSLDVELTVRLARACGGQAR